MAVNLTPGAISLISTSKCAYLSKDLKPVLQLMCNSSGTFTLDKKQWYLAGLSDGSFWQVGLIADDIFISNKLQKGSILQLTQFQTEHRISEGEVISNILVIDVHVILTKWDIIGKPKEYPPTKTSSIEKSTPVDHADVDHAKVASMMMEKNKEDDDMCACFKKLENIGWGTEDPLYDTALLLFGGSAVYRKLWLLLKPESCGKWVKNAGSKFGLLG